MEKKWDKMTPKERSEYVNQDHVRQKEMTWPDFERYVPPDEEFWGRSIPNACTRDKLIHDLYFIDGMKQVDIVYHLEISERGLYDILQNIKSIAKQKDYKALSDLLGVSERYARILIDDKKLYSNRK